MAQELQYTSKVTGSLEKAQGGDGRLSVSARSGDRGYYNSRDVGECFSVAFDFQSAEAGEYGFYFKNTSSTGKDFVVTSIGVGSVEASRIKLVSVSGTAGGGTELTPTNMNLSSPNAATGSAMEGGSAATGITGLTEIALIDFVYVSATSHEPLRVGDTLRLGPNDAIALEYDEGTAGDFSGVMFGYFE